MNNFIAIKITINEVNEFKVIVFYNTYNDIVI